MVGVRKLVSNLFGVDARRTVDPMQAVALGAAIHAGVLSGELRGVRVLQAWQADLGRMLEGRRQSEPAGVGVGTPGVKSMGRQEEESAAAKAAEAEEEEAAMEAALAAMRRGEAGATAPPEVELEEEVEIQIGVDELRQMMGRDEAAIVESLRRAEQAAAEQAAAVQAAAVQAAAEQAAAEQVAEGAKEIAAGKPPAGVDINALFRQMGHSGEDGGVL